jgi:hypothetical protein
MYHEYQFVNRNNTMKTKTLSVIIIAFWGFDGPLNNKSPSVDLKHILLLLYNSIFSLYKYKRNIQQPRIESVKRILVLSIVLFVVYSLLQIEGELNKHVSFWIVCDVISTLYNVILKFGFNEVTFLVVSEIKCYWVILKTKSNRFKIGDVYHTKCQTLLLNKLSNNCYF